MSDVTAPHSADSVHGPVWLWLKLAYRYGFPAAVAAFLLYFVTHVMAADVRDTRTDISAMKAEQQRTARQLFGICMVLSKGDAIAERWCKVGSLAGEAEGGQ